MDNRCFRLLALHQPMATDLRAIVAAVKINTDLERVGDLAVNIAEAGVRYTILAPWQAAASGLDHERLYRVAVGGGRDIVVAFYDGQRSAAVSFEPSATADAEQFAQALQAGSGEGADAQVGITLVATDGELYGHHLEFRDLFLETLTTMPTERLGRRLTTVGEEVAENGDCLRRGCVVPACVLGGFLADGRIGIAHGAAVRGIGDVFDFRAVVGALQQGETRESAA